jgi:pyruvate formate lyase activating enzyme
MSYEQVLESAVLWDKKRGDKVACKLCNWRCVIADGKVGHCAVRKNVGGVLYSLNYHKVCAANADPIEKKPLFHFLPSTSSYSISTPGCNFRCDFCQNWQISQMALEHGWIDGQDISPEDIIDDAKFNGCSSIAYTYTEPTIFMELCADCGTLAKAAGLKNVFVSNGYMTPEAVDFAADWLDAINIDLKSFNDDYYKNLCKARLKPVLDTIKYIAKHTDIWMELTTLIIPGSNDSDDELKAIADFIVSKTGSDTPWHISRFFPTYKMDSQKATPIETLERAYEIGNQAGLRDVYVGNLPGADAESTVCYNCGEMLIARTGYAVTDMNIKDGACPKCETAIAGRW